MRVLIALCLATLAVAEEKRLILSDLSGFAQCEAKLNRAECTSCCDSAFHGILASLEKAGCHEACKILPSGKRQLLGEAAKIARCEAKLHEGPCIQCCDDTFHGLLGAVERPACHAACRILPKRQLLGEAAKFARCEAKLHEGPCIQCCDDTFHGLLGAIERPACHAACRILPKKRQLLGEAAKFARCEAKLHEGPCIQCCDDTFHGLLGAIERPACHLACRALPKKRQLLGEAAKFARCEAKLHEGPCIQCCDDTFHGLLGAIERPACHLACRALPKKRQLLGEAAKFARCEAKLHEGPCIQCCDDTFHGLLGAIERPACHAACRILPKRQLGDFTHQIAECERERSRSACESCCSSAFHGGRLAEAERLLCDAGCRRLHN